VKPWGEPIPHHGSYVVPVGIIHLAGGSSTSTMVTQENEVGGCESRSEDLALKEAQRRGGRKYTDRNKIILHAPKRKRQMA